MNNSIEAAPRLNREWRALLLFAVYHFVVASALLLLQENQPALGFGQVDPSLFRQVAFVLLVYSGISFWLALLRYPAFDQQLHVTLLVDIVGLTVLMQASGGVDSGLGALLAVSLAIGSLMTHGITIFVFAAFASTAVIVAQTFYFNYGPGSIGGFLQAGMLGIIFFAIALVDFALSRRLQSTERQVQEKELHLANLNEVNAFVVDLLDLGVIVVDEKDQVTLINETAAKWLGSTKNPQARSSLAGLSPDLELILSAWRLESAEGQARERSLETETDELNLEFISLGQAGRHGGVLILLRDMERVRAEAHKAQLAAVGRMSASIAHEIRNPLSAISQAAQLLPEIDGATAQHERLADIITRNTKRLDQVIENTLALSRNREPDRQPIELCAFVERLAKQFTTNPRLADADIVVTCASPAQALIDPSHLEQVLVVLCENAVKHADRESDQLRIELGVGVDDAGAPTLDVTDNGRGISVDVARKIFDPFFSTGGSAGLGLFLAKQLCERNNASLMLETAGGWTGARFRIKMSPV